MIKYILAFLGFMVYRYGGAIAGFLLGSLLDNMLGGFKKNSTGRGYERPRPGFDPRARRGNTRVTPGDFELNLISLASIVIKADGKVSQTELDYVRQYFVQSYGKERANAIFRTFNDVIKSREVSAQRICQYLNAKTRYETRLQLLHFLFGIAQADGTVSSAEIRTLQSIAGYLQLSNADYVSIKNMFIREQDNAYKILEISKSASNDEVKKAYRTMAKKYHPDKVRHLEAAHVKMAEEKFKEVQKAYEQIQKERGL